jgi:hypothetical protein
MRTKSLIAIELSWYQGRQKTEILEQNTAIVEGYEAWAEFAAAVRDEV